jgi:hypothetical protein
MYRSTSATRQAVTRLPILIGAGASPDLTFAHQEDLPIGTSAGTGGFALGLPTICVKRKRATLEDEGVCRIVKTSLSSLETTVILLRTVPLSSSKSEHDFAVASEPRVFSCVDRKSVVRESFVFYRRPLKNQRSQAFV